MIAALPRHSTGSSLGNAAEGPADKGLHAFLHVQPSQPVDDPVAVAPIRGLDVFHRRPIPDIRNTREPKDRAAVAKAEELCLLLIGEPDFNDFVGILHANSISLPKSSVQRASPVKRLQETRTDTMRQITAFDAHGRGICKAQAAQPDQFLARREAQNLRYPPGSRYDLQGQHFRAGTKTQGRHFFRKGLDLAEVLVESHARDKRPLALQAVSNAQMAKGFQGLASGHAAHFISRGKLLLGKKRIPRL